MKEVIVITVFSAILAVASAHSRLFHPAGDSNAVHASNLAAGSDLARHNGTAHHAR